MFLFPLLKFHQEMFFSIFLLDSNLFEKSVLSLFKRLSFNSFLLHFIFFLFDLSYEKNSSVFLK